MKFSFDGRRYSLSFQRAHQSVTVYKKRKPVQVESKYPYTTVTLYELTTSMPVKLASATAGCLPTDNYSHELGRVAALRALIKILTKRLGVSKEFRSTLWDAYANRSKEQKAATVIDVVATRVPLALPTSSATETVQ